MRILTLGALIVAAGTLAALPFRRNQEKTQSLPPTDATGPTRSNLFGLDFETVVDDPAAKAELPSLALKPMDQWEQEKRQLQMPLTYDDLAVPLKLPQSFQEDFNATTTAQAARETASAGTVPASERMERATLSKNSDSSIANRAGSMLVSEPSTATVETKTAELISTPSIVRPVTQALPQQTPRMMHWIRQP